MRTRTQDPAGAVERTATAPAALSPAEFSAKRRGPLRRYFYDHPRVMDAVVAAVYLLLSLFAVVPSLMTGQLLHPVLILASAGLLMFRRTHPVPVLAVLLVFETVLLAVEPYSSNAGASLWFALYAVALARRPLFSFAAAAAASLPLVVVFLFFFRMPAELIHEGGLSQQTTGLISSIVIVLSNVVATGIGLSVRRNREHEAELRVWADRHAKLASVTERNRIAREMHDVVAHSLTVMVALSDGAAVVVKRDPGRAGPVLEELSRTGRTALADMRRVLGVLRQDGSLEKAALEPMPDGGGIEPLLAGFRRVGLPLHVSQSGPQLPVDPAFALTVYRILQESLTNTLRYGRSVYRVSVEIAHTVQPDGASQVLLRITDDGRGTEEGSMGTGQGITGMKERAGIYAGTVTAGPGPRGGWIVEAVLNPTIVCPKATSVQVHEAGAAPTPLARPDAGTQPLKDAP
ncbi:sensor histidine kinase [Arthrobacter sp. 35W]|uniref:sensor histidine kinase n=1 Tax=Arthrobacter sp. 35W TaxID=1132441 RepID=UPI0004190DD8|nr:histidine kinase [Arthrobacter sp. 35W]